VYEASRIATTRMQSNNYARANWIADSAHIPPNRICTSYERLTCNGEAMNVCTGRWPGCRGRAANNPLENNPAPLRGQPQPLAGMLGILGDWDKRSSCTVTRYKHIVARLPVVACKRLSTVQRSPYTGVCDRSPPATRGCCLGHSHSARLLHSLPIFRSL